MDTFPDGEICVQIEESVRGSDVFVVQSTCPPRTNNYLMELFIMIDALKRASAARITAVLPFFGYARQDRKDRPRVPITAKLVANLLVAAGADRVLTMDLHARQIQGFFDIPVDHLTANPVLIEHIKNLGTDNLTIVSPDEGGIKKAYNVATILSRPLAIVAKRRVSAENVEATTLIGDVDGKDVLLVDDMTETAGTLTAAAKLLKGKGANHIYACVSHAILDEKGQSRLRESAIEQLISTDSVPSTPVAGINHNVVSVAGLLGTAIERIHKNLSVASLFTT